MVSSMGGRRLSDDVGDGEFMWRSRLGRSVLADGRARPLDRGDELARAVGLREKSLDLAAGPAALDGDVQVPRRDDDGDARTPVAKPVKDLGAVELGHRHVQ